MVEIGFFPLGGNPYLKNINQVEVDGKELRYFDLTSLQDSRYGMYDVVRRHKNHFAVFVGAFISSEFVRLGSTLSIFFA